MVQWKLRRKFSPSQKKTELVILRPVHEEAHRREKCFICPLGQQKYYIWEYKSKSASRNSKIVNIHILMSRARLKTPSNVFLGDKARRQYFFSKSPLNIYRRSWSRKKSKVVLLCDLITTRLVSYNAKAKSKNVFISQRRMFYPLSPISCCGKTLPGTERGDENIPFLLCPVGFPPPLQRNIKKSLPVSLPRKGRIWVRSTVPKTSQVRSSSEQDQSAFVLRRG